MSLIENSSHSDENFCSRCYNCCCLEKGQYSCEDMFCNVLCCKQSLNKECVTHTLCDDESSQCCRIFYYTSLECGCKCCLPACEKCHKVKALEKGICGECWDEMLLEIKNLHEYLKKLFSERRFSETYTQPKTQQSDLLKYGVYDKATAKSWLIQNHPDRCANMDEFNVEVFQMILHYYQSF